MNISILVPSRNRPNEFKRMFESALQTAKDPFEVVVYKDMDDTSEYIKHPYIKEIRGERIVLSNMWNECFKQATGDIFMHAGDDIIFRTKDWDETIKEAFTRYEDRIVFVFGDDGYFGDKFGTHGFIHRNWVEALGYFVPPYFSSDYNDTWLNDLAERIGRKVYVPIVTEHMHWTFGKSEKDQTHLERIERHQKDGVEGIYASKIEERAKDADKLRTKMYV